MRTTHTPGPWIVEQGGFQIASGGTVIAKILAHGFDADLCEACADARLIAAGPELLAACELVLREWMTCLFCGTGDTCCDCEDPVGLAVRAALAKARGEEAPSG